MKKLWFNLPIRFKILSFYFVIVVLLFIPLLVYNQNNSEILNQLNETIDNNYKVYIVMEKTSQDLKDVEKYLFADDDAALDSYNSNKKEVDALLDDLYSIEPSLESYFRINAIYYSVKAYKELCDSAIEKKQMDDERYFVDYYKAQNIQKYTNQYFNELLLENLKDESQKAEEVKSNAYSIRRTSLNLIIVVIFLAFVLGVLISNNIVNPIKKLSLYSKKISQGNLDIQEVNINSKDEIGDLSRAYNHMGKSIKSYVERIKEKANIEKQLHEEEREVMKMEQLLQQAKLEALQSKINPHFLFNTLNVIFRTALFEKANETMSLIQMLSKIFRYQLKSAGEKVSLDEEKVLITDYLKLQSARFKERLKYEIDIESNIDVSIPVLTLQPLVENAIIHGIGPKIDGGMIKIRAYEKADKVIIEVTDDGVGMDSEVVRKLNSNMEINTKSKASIGVRNVRDRFMLTFPNRGKFIIQSNKDMGTSIKMIIQRKEAKPNV